MKVISLSALLLVCYLWPLRALSQEPVTVGEAGIARYPHIHFGSTLLDEDGKPLAGFHQITFYIYAGEDRDGDLLWSETLPVQSDENGTIA